MARNSKEKDSTYNKAYYDAHKTDPEWRAKRQQAANRRNRQRQFETRKERWLEVLDMIGLHETLGETGEQIAEGLASLYSLKSLSSSLSPSSAAARPARTQEGE